MSLCNHLLQKQSRSMNRQNVKCLEQNLRLKSSLKKTSCAVNDVTGGPMAQEEGVTQGMEQVHTSLAPSILSNEGKEAVH